MINKIQNKYLQKIGKILPYHIDIYLPEFKNTSHKCKLTSFAPENIKCETWFNLFKNSVLEAIEKKIYLPICRFADGEFLFMNNGLDIIDYRLGLKDKIKMFVINNLVKLNLRPFHPHTHNKYSSGQYYHDEIIKVNARYKNGIKHILKNGVLATSTIVTKDPFTERFFNLFSDFILDNDIKISCLNNIPYIFVYALFSGKSRFEILKDRNILIINSFNIDQKKIVTKKLKSFGVKKILYKNISSNRSVYDVLDINNDIEIDLILIGAGVGKVLHFEYLSKFRVPCIDIGYIFQTWLDPTCSADRAFCSPDDLYNSSMDK